VLPYPQAKVASGVHAVTTAVTELHALSWTLKGTTDPGLRVVDEGESGKRGWGSTVGMGSDSRGIYPYTSNNRMKRYVW